MHNAAADLCVHCSRRLNTEGQHDLAVALAQELVEGLKATKAPPIEEHFARLRAIVEGIP